MTKLTSIITLSEKKLGDRGNAILAIRSLLKCGIEFPESSKEKFNYFCLLILILENDAEKIFSKTMIGQNPYLITSDMISKYEKPVLLGMSEMYQAILTNYLTLLNVEKDSSILISLFHILCHRDYEIRKQMKEVIQNLLKLDDKLYSILLQASFYFLESLDVKFFKFL